MSRPRSREHFPRMKVRGGRRRLNAQIAKAWRGTNDSIATASQHFVRISVDARAFVEAMDRMARHVVHYAFVVVPWLERRQRADEWVSSHMLTATPSPWAAPTRTETH
jgi:hypothetical protein